jgi:hypothetical protein
MSELEKVYDLVREQEKQARDRHDTVMVALTEVKAAHENCLNRTLIESVEKKIDDHLEEEKWQERISRFAQALVAGAAAVLGYKYIK